MENSKVAASEMSIVTPEWVKDAVFYQIFPDRFAQSSKVVKPSNLEPWASPPTAHGFKGGDLLGIVENIDYLQDLGITALYLNPIFSSAANHRYHTHDYLTVDPLLGGNEALRTLLEVAHRRGMRVVLDGVFNHASRGFFQFNHALENGPFSPYLDWFHLHQFPVNAYGPGKPNYDAWWDLPALPKFNVATPAVRDFLWSVGQYWLEFGIDGWRLDVPNEIDDNEFWREFRRRVKGVSPDAYICGEIWREARRWLQGDMFDSVMNYLFTKACLSFFIARMDVTTLEGTGYSGTVREDGPDAAKFGAEIATLLKLYSPEITSVQLNLLDSHDTARFLTTAREDETALRLATLFQMCYPGAPCIYYGDEIGMTGHKDPDCRRSFPWEQRHWNTSLHSFFKEAIRLRQTFPALRRGSYDTLHAEKQLYVFGRADQREKLIIALNNGQSPTALPSLQHYLSEGALLVERFSTIPGLSNRAYRVGSGGLLEDYSLPARSGTVFEVIAN